MEDRRLLSVFADAINYPSGGSGPDSVAVGDFNRDGISDLAVANETGNTVGILLGDGSGGFAAASTYLSGGNGPYSVAIGDFNGDGNSDLAVANYGSNTLGAGNTVGILLGDGNGGFAVASTFSTGGSYPVTVAVGDFNRDGKSDLAVANYASGGDTVGILSGDGSGGFAAASTFYTGPYTRSVTVGDFNGDGISDLVVTNYYDNLAREYLGDCSGGFTLESNFYTGGNGPIEVSVGDFNRDGKSDLAVANYNSNTGSVGILLGNGSGGFAAASTFSSGGSYSGCLTVGDFNGDGKNDLAVTNSDSNTVGLLLGDGSGGFPTTSTFSTGGNGPRSVTVGDFNGDGKSDLVVTNYYSSTVGVILSNGYDGGGEFAATTTFSSGGSGPQYLTVGDFNRDGKSDLAVGNYSSFGPVGELLGDGIDSFDAAIPIFSGNGGDRPVGITVGDFNRDGISDLVVTNHDSNNVGILIGNGDGSYAAARTLSSGGMGPYSAAMGDFNRDGKNDLAVANSSDGTVGILIGDGNGGFSPVITYSSGGGGSQIVTVGDFNRDGKIDLAVNNYSSNTVGVLLGDGSGGFAAATTFSPGGSGPTSVAVGDFNRDGKSDLVVTNYGSNTVGVLLGDGNGEFLPATTFPSGGYNPVYVTVGDFNRDGKSDLAVANSSDGTVGIFFGGGNGGFSPVITYSSGGSNPIALTVGDFNRDGKSDLAVTNYGSDTVGVLLNISAPPITNAPPTLTVDHPSVSTGEGQTVTNSGTWSDVPADSVMMTASVGTITKNEDGTWTWTYTPTDDANQPASVTITADDGEPNGRSSITFALVVNNLPPTLSVDHVSVSTGEGQLVTNTGTWGDVGADKPNVTLSASVGTVIKHDNGTWSWSYTPTDNAGQPTTVTITADDGESSSNTMTLFANATTFPTGGSDLESMTVGDFNGDGYSDLAVTNQTSNNVGVLLGDGRGGFAVATTFNSGGSYSHSVAVGDFNGDGKKDLAVANRLSNNVGILLGNGNGGFAAPSTFSTGGSDPYSVTVGDFNNDGKSDLAIANITTNTVGVLLGDGIGGFVAATTFSSGGSGPYLITVGDFNGDGKSDLAVVNNVSNTVGVLLGDGSGGFKAASTFSTGSGGPVSVSVGHFNRDGKSDLAVVNYFSNTVGVLLGDGSGNFATLSTFSSGGIHPYSVSVGDFNGDGKSDLAAANYDSGSVGVLLGDGSGGFAAVTTFSSGGSGPRSVTVGDFNGDGKSDLAVTNYDSGTVGVLLNISEPPSQSSITFGLAVNNLPPTLTVDHPSVSTGEGQTVTNSGTWSDVPADSVMMTASVGTITKNEDGTWTWTYTPTDDANQPASVTITADDGEPNGRSSITFALAVNNLPPTLTVDHPSVSTGEGQEVTNSGTWNDVAADKPNVVLSASVGTVIKNSDGTWDWCYTPEDDAGQPTTVTITADDGESSSTTTLFAPAVKYQSGGDHPWYIASDDLNGDGKSDLVVANVNSNNVAVLLGNGNGTFSAAGTFQSGGVAPESVAIGDFNGDGKCDVAVTNWGSNTVGVLLGDGYGALRAASTYSTGGTGPTFVAVGDFNRDGKLDLAVTNYNDNTVGILLGNADGTFRAAKTFSTGGPTPYFLLVSDLNGDGWSDLAIVNSDQKTWGPNGNVGILLGIDDGDDVSFAFPVAFPTGGLNPYSVAQGDFNHDHKPDLAVTNHLSGTVGVLLGNGSGGFASPVTYSSGGYYPYTLVTGDFNLDGKTDIAVADFNSDSNNVGILLGKCDGGFEMTTLLPSGGGRAAFLATDDFNGDGKSDLAVVNHDEGTVSALLNVAQPPSKSCITFGLTVNNLPPTLTVDQASVSTGEGQTVTNSGTWSDVAADRPNVTLTASVGHVTWDNDGTWSWSYTPTDDQGQPASVTITADDHEAQNHIGTVTFTLTVNNLPPTLTVVNSSVSTGEGQTVTNTGTWSDVLADRPNVKFTASIGHVTWDDGIWSWSYTPSDDEGQPTTVTITADDGKSSSTTTLFAPAVKYPSGGDHPWYIASGDLDGDGKADLVVANVNNNNNNVAVHLGIGDGSFRPAQAYSSGGDAPESVAIGDFNGDGKMDVAVTNWASIDPTHAVGVLLNDGNGSLRPAVTYSSGGTGPTFVAVGDFNGDGKDDLAVTNYWDNTVGILLNNGDGSFGQATTYSTGGPTPYSLLVSDFNGDGHSDLAIANSDQRTWGPNGNVGILLGNGDGTFASATTFSTGGLNPYSVAQGDFDGDGTPDLAVTNHLSRSVGVLLGNGNGGFASPVTYSSGGDYPYTLVTGDFNVDGRDDIAVADFNSDSNNVGILLSKCDGSFEATTLLPSGGGRAAFLATDDFNGDGKSDLAVVNHDENTLSVLLNVAQPPSKSCITFGLTVNNLPPHDVIITPDPANVYSEGQTLRFTASAVDVPADTVGYTWTVTKDGSIVRSGSGTAIDFTAIDNGQFTVTVVASDDELNGTADPVSMTVSVSNVAPTIINAQLTPTEIYASQTVVLTGTVTDPGSLDTHTVRVVWGDGGTSENVAVDPATRTFRVEYTYALKAVDEPIKNYQVSVVAIDKDGTPSETVLLNERVNYYAHLDLSGLVFDDLNNNGLFEPANGEMGIAGVTVQLVNQATGEMAAPPITTDKDGVYRIVANVDCGIYALEEIQPAAYLDGNETAGSLGGTIDNSKDWNKIADLVFATGNQIGSDYLFGEIRASRIQGLVWQDFNDDGEVDFGEKAIEGVELRLTGTDDRGAAVDKLMSTESQGIFEFIDLRPGTYTLTENQPAGYADGMDRVGMVDGVISGVNNVNDQISQIVLPRPGSDGVNYNFAERPLASGSVGAGQTATIGFWQNKHGQTLIRSLNGGQNSTQLGNWLAVTFPNMYGTNAGNYNLTGKTNAQIADIYTSLFKRDAKTALAGPPKLDAQVMAVALAVYVTNYSLAGTTAANYGFVVTENGVGTATFDVGSANRAAFGLSSTQSTVMQVLDILQATDSLTKKGILYDLDGSGTINSLEKMLREMANTVFTAINERGQL